MTIFSPTQRKSLFLLCSIMAAPNVNGRLHRCPPKTCSFFHCYFQTREIGEPCRDCSNATRWARLNIQNISPRTNPYLLRSSRLFLSSHDKVKQISGCPCKLQIKYFNVVKAAIFISASHNIRYSIQNSKQNKTNTTIDKQIDR